MSTRPSFNLTISMGAVMVQPVARRMPRCASSAGPTCLIENKHISDTLHALYITGSASLWKGRKFVSVPDLDLVRYADSQTHRLYDSWSRPPIFDTSNRVAVRTLFTEYPYRISCRSQAAIFTL